MDLTIGNTFSVDEIQIILEALSAISKRDNAYLQRQKRLMPPKGYHFWDTVNAFGCNEFFLLNEDDILETTVGRFDDGRGYVVDIDLPVKGRRQGEFEACVITFEVDRRNDPSLVGIQGAYW